MADESKTPNTGDDWQEVGRQFKVLGNNLADAFRASWENEENRRRLLDMQAGLETMVKEVNKAIHESVSSPQAQQARTQAAKTAETFRTAAEQSAPEIRAQLLAALRQVNEELRKLVNRMESGKPSGPPPESK
jgi:hypothetical protein